MPAPVGPYLHTLSGTLDAEQEFEEAGAGPTAFPATTLTGMTVALEANSVYHFTASVKYDPDAAAGFVFFQLGKPAGASVRAIAGDASDAIGGTAVSIYPAPSATYVIITGTCETAGTAGNLTVQLGIDSVAGPYTVTVQVPSYLLVTKIV